MRARDLSAGVGPALDPYRALIEAGTLDGQDWSFFGGEAPASRYASLRLAFERLARSGGGTVVETGTIRSYVHGGLPGCNEGDDALWTPDRPERWDWGAGCFTLLAAKCLAGTGSTIHTVDVSAEHIRRCRVATAPWAASIRYHVADSAAFLRAFDEKIGLLYLDAGDIWPVEPSAIHQLEEAKAAVERGLLPPSALVLLDDVRNTTPPKFGEASRLGKSKYALPYLLSKGFRVVFDGYQVLLAAP